MQQKHPGGFIRSNPAESMLLGWCPVGLSPVGFCIAPTPGGAACSLPRPTLFAWVYIPTKPPGINKPLLPRLMKG